jgi:hypothetical protein
VGDTWYDLATDTIFRYVYDGTNYFWQDISGGSIVANVSGVPTYANANAVAYGEAGWAGNIIPSANATYSLGNVTNQWKSLYVSNTTVYIGNVALSTDGNTLSVAGNPVVVASSGDSIALTGNLSAQGNVTGNYIIGNGSQLTGLPASYANSNVSSFLSAFGSNTISTTGTVNAGNITGANILTVGLISATGAITGNTLVAGGLSLTGNTIVGAGPTIIIDPNGSGGVDGAVVISGNLSVQGNVTYIDSNVITTNEKSITLANNQNTGTALDGAGIDVGNNTLAYWRFNNATTSWQSNIGLTPAANATLNLGGGSNYWATIYATGATVSGNVTGGNVLTAGRVSATGNIQGSYILGNGSQLTGVTAGITTGKSLAITLIMGG